MIEMRCNHCRKWKPDYEFHKDTTVTSGLRGECKQCALAKAAKRRAIQRNERGQIVSRTKEADREQLAKDLCAAVLTYWHIAFKPEKPRFGVAMIGGGHV